MDAVTNEKCELHRDIEAVVTFYCLRGNTPTKLFEKMKSVHGKDCLSCTQGFALHNEFLVGRETTELCDSQCSG